MENRRLQLRVVTALAILLLLIPAATGASPRHPESVTLVAVQMKVSPEIYQSAETFEQAVDCWMQAASHRFQGERNLVAFPEDVGLGLLLTGYYDTIVQSPIFQAAPSFQTAAYILYQQDEIMPEVNNLLMQGYSLGHALLLVRGDLIQKVYYETFSEAARKYHVTLVAGSAPIPGENGTVYNTSYVFGPKGQLLGVQRKVHLVDLEGPGGLDLTQGDVNEIRTISTPAGVLGVAICLDAFYEDVIDSLVEGGAQILVQPSFNPHVWDAWQIQDWQRGMWTAVKDHHSLIAGVNPMMVGGLWDIQVEGVSSIVGRCPILPFYGYLDWARSPTAGDIVSVRMLIPK